MLACKGKQIFSVKINFKNCFFFRCWYFQFYSFLCVYSLCIQLKHVDPNAPKLASLCLKTFSEIDFYQFAVRIILTSSRCVNLALPPFPTTFPQSSRFELTSENQTEEESHDYVRVVESNGGHLIAVNYRTHSQEHHQQQPHSHRSPGMSEFWKTSGKEGAVCPRRSSFWSDGDSSRRCPDKQSLIVFG